MKTAKARLILLAFLAVAVLWPAFAALAADQAAPPIPPPDPMLVKRAQEAAARGQGFQFIPPTYSSDEAKTTGPSSSGSGDGVKVIHNGDAPLIGNVGPNKTNARAGSVNAKGSAEAFDPFAPTGSNTAGFVFIALGIGIFIASKFFPLVPQSAGFLSIGVGVVLLIAPTFLQDHPWVGIVAAGVLGLVCLLVVGYKAKWFDHAIAAPVQTKLINDGDPAGAGALAHLQANAPFAGSKVAVAASRVIKAASDHLDEVESLLAPKAPPG